MGYCQFGLNHKRLKNNLIIVPKQETQHDEPKNEKQFKNKSSGYDDIRKKVDDNQSFNIENKNNKSKHSEPKKLLNIF